MQDNSKFQLFYEKEGMLAHRYDSENFWERRYHRKKASILAGVLENLNVKGCLVLDAGCGTGEIGLIASRLGAQVVSVDFSKSYLKRASKNNNRVCASLRNLPFKKAAFNVVICADVIEHIKDQDTVITELEDVSSRKTIFTTPCHGIFRALYGKLFSRQLEALDKKVGHLGIFPLLFFRNKLQRADCNVVCKSYHVIQPIADRFLSKRAELLVDFVERIGNLILPNQGTISLAIISLQRILN